MSEYATRHFDHKIVRVGTCEIMNGLRFEQQDEVFRSSIDFDSVPNLFWRLPVPEEDGTRPGNYSDIEPAVRLVGTKGVFGDPGFADRPGTIQIKHNSGLLLSIQCYHGYKLPNGSSDIRTSWNGKHQFFELVYIKSTEDYSLHPVFRCGHCKKKWSCDWEDILPYIADKTLKRRLELYSKSPNIEAMKEVK
jgi:hypothetical protein